LNGIISRFLKTGTLTYCAWKITFLDTEKHYKAREILWINIFEDVKTDFVMLFGVWKCDDLGTISYCISVIWVYTTSLSSSHPYVLVVVSQQYRIIIKSVILGAKLY